MHLFDKSLLVVAFCATTLLKIGSKYAIVAQLLHIRIRCPVEAAPRRPHLQWTFAVRRLRTRYTIEGHKESAWPLRADIVDSQPHALYGARRHDVVEELPCRCPVDHCRRVRDRERPDDGGRGG